MPLAAGSADPSIMWRNSTKRRINLARVYNSRKRILVTGGAGFLGSHLIDRLLGDGHEILCADNLFTGTKQNIEHLHSHPRFEFLRHDVTFPLFVEIDEIYNLACPASPIHYQQAGVVCVCGQRAQAAPPSLSHKQVVGEAL